MHYEDVVVSLLKTASMHQMPDATLW